jgi:carbon monoxide dehydrogenase subunit G
VNFRYSFRLPVPAERAWPILLDLRRVAPCMPGAAIESGEDDTYVGRVKVKIGPIEMTYRGDLVFVERDDAAHRLQVRGTGREIRGGGEAKVVSTMQVRPDGDSCEVSIDSDYALSGRAAQFGTGLIDEIGAKLMKEFAVRLERLLRDGEGTAVPSAAAPAAPPGPAVAPGPDTVAPPQARRENNEALDLVGVAWGPVISRAIPVINLLLTVWIVIYLMVFDR